MQHSKTVGRIRRKFRVLNPEMDERRRRQWAAAEARELGWGGVTLVAQATGLSRPTITAGLRELDLPAKQRAAWAARVRRPGGGRPALIETDPGTSKWNEIEHRLFSFNTQNRRGKRLVSHQAIVNLVAGTRTRTGLVVKAALDTNRYETKIKVSDAELARLRPAPHEGTTLNPTRKRGSLITSTRQQRTLTRSASEGTTRTRIAREANPPPARIARICPLAMAQPKPHAPQLLLLAAFSGQDEALAWARHKAQSAWGDIALGSGTFPFHDTDYYAREMGTDLRKVFFAFERLIDPGELAAIKLLTNAWEREYAQSPAACSPSAACSANPPGASSAHARPGPRPLNLDPGYLGLGKLVLASTKDHAHRIYLGQGIFGEVTLHYVRGLGWQPLPWTFPDYRRPGALDFFTRCREYLYAHHQAQLQRESGEDA